MRRLMFVLFVSACRSMAPSAYCTVGDGKRLDVTGRSDGVYGIVDEHVADTPLFRFDQIVRTGEGVDPASGKRWLRFTLQEPEAKLLEAFTQAPVGRGIAVVVEGEVACAHKIRVPLHTSEIQLSCCNPHACERWKTLVHAQ